MSKYSTFPEDFAAEEPKKPAVERQVSSVASSSRSKRPISPPPRARPGFKKPSAIEAEPTLFFTDKRGDKGNAIYGKSASQLVKYKAPPSKSRVAIQKYLEDSLSKEDNRHVIGDEWREWELLEMVKTKEHQPLATNADGFMSFIAPSTAASSSDEIPVAKDDEYEKRRRLNAAVNNNPGNIEGWLELLDFQDELKDLKDDASRRERKIAILDRAIKHNPDNADLMIRRFRFQSVECEFGKLLESVELASEKVRANPDEYYKLVLFKMELLQCSHPSIGFFELRTLYAGVIQQNIGGDERLLVHMVLRVVNLDVVAGYHEHAVALCMSLLEMSFDQSARSWSDKLSALGSRWEYGEPFIGECRSEHYLPVPKSKGLPKRSFEASDDDDPDAIVLFEDLIEFLFEIKNKHHLQHIIRMFLKLFGLRIPSEQVSTQMLNDGLLYYDDDLFRGADVDLDRLLSNSAVFPACSSTIFATKAMFHEQQHVNFLRNILIDLARTDRLYEAYLVYVEAQLDRVNARRILFDRIRQDPQDFYLSLLLAQMELVDSPELAEKVCLGVIRNNRFDLGAVGLMRTWIELKIQAKSPGNDVVDFVLSALEQTQPSEVSVLVSERRLSAMTVSAGQDVQNASDSMLLTEQFLDAVACQMWLSFLFRGHYEHALDVFYDTVEKYIVPGTPSHQLCFIQLDRFFRLSKLVPPPKKPLPEKTALASDELARLFPWNTFLFSSFCDGEEKQSLVRKFISDKLNSSSVLCHIYSIYALVSKRNGIDVSAKLRDLCRAAASAHSSNFIFRRLFMGLLMQVRNMQASSKAFMFSSLKKFSFCVAFYELALTFPNLEAQEIQDIKDIMSQRELRLQ